MSLLTHTVRWGTGGLLLLLAACTSPVEDRLDTAALEMRQGAYENALTIYEEVLLDVPDAPNLHNNMGYSLLQLGRYDEALEHFETAYGGGTGHTDASLLHNWGNALEKLASFEEAEKKYAAAAGADPSRADVFINWGNVLSRLDRLEEAATRYEQGTKNDPDSAVGWFNWGYTLERLSRHQDALHCYKIFLSLDNPGPSNLVEHARRYVSGAKGAGKGDTDL